MNTIMLAIVVGVAFGFVLDRIGATNPNLIIGMLRLGRLHLMKTILGAIGIASIGLFGGLMAGLIEPSHLSVKAAYVGVVIGGALLGAGFAVAGYCPGTGLAAAATGRKDALFFVLGGLAGAAAFMGSFEWVKATGVLEKVLGGSSTLGTIAGTKYPALFAGLSGEAIGIAMGVLLVVIAFLLPDRLMGSRPSRDGKPQDLATAKP